MSGEQVWLVTHKWQEIGLWTEKHYEKIFNSWVYCTEWERGEHWLWVQHCGVLRKDCEDKLNSTSACRTKPCRQAGWGVLCEEGWHQEHQTDKEPHSHTTFCTALLSCLVCVHSVQERISPLKRPKRSASQSLKRRIVKKKELWSHTSEEDDKKQDTCCTGNH